MALSIVGPIVMGLIAGAVDLFFMVKDESGDAKTVISHAAGALVPIIIFSFANVPMVITNKFIISFVFQTKQDRLEPKHLLTFF